MRTYQKLLLLILIPAVLQNCAEEDENLNPEKIQLAVLASKDGRQSLTSANASISQQGTVIATYNFEDKINQLSFGGNPDLPYTVIIEKDGYATFKQEFKLGEMLNKIKGLPLKVHLTPALTMTAHPATWDTEPTFEIRLVGSGNIKVDWGDGSSTSYTMTTYYPEALVTHKYAEEKAYRITVTGDLNKITEFNSYYGHGNLSKLNVDHLTELTEFDFGLSVTPKRIDLRHNRKLKRVGLPELHVLDNVMLPSRHDIRSIDISGSPGLDDDVNEIINNIYENTVAGSIRDGYFIFRSYSHAEPDDEALIGPPSAEALAKLKKLRDNYGWEIYPDVWD